MGTAAAADNRAACAEDQNKLEGSSPEPSSEELPKEIKANTQENAIDNSEEQTGGSLGALDKTDEANKTEVGADSVAKATPTDNDRKPRRLAGRLGQKNESEDHDEGNAPSDIQRRSDAFKVRWPTI